MILVFSEEDLSKKSFLWFAKKNGGMSNQVKTFFEEKGKRGL